MLENAVLRHQVNVLRRRRRVASTAEDLGEQRAGAAADVDHGPDSDLRR